MRSEGSAESSNHERRHQSKRRPPVRMNWRKRSAPFSLDENTEVKRRTHESCKWRNMPIPVSLPSGPGTRKMTRREVADESGILYGRSSILIHFNQPSVIIDVLLYWLRVWLFKNYLCSSLFLISNDHSSAKN
ncbi:hypothetical protein NPIL_437801 [Nephila pilipes]|uniref:Uncharacterized protein n=1 Tax=Nephila pilipes TaxID=299642 RepID=A0A8X6NZU7_NEPPI|nr:hypothetical protein NPIL_437801 [Nephila pilipes]